MSAVQDSWSRITEIFEVAAELPSEERDSYLVEACAGDPHILREVQALLTADAEAGPLDRSLDTIAASLFPDDDTGAGADGSLTGQLVGAYRILGLLGRGGMGTVYLAERADGSFERQVALKVVRGGLGSPTLEAHFLRERRILARLEHPNIARLFDAGLTEDGSPYLVMELVDGRPITAYASEEGLDLDERLSLFLDVLEAVRHAHRNLVIHRDLKPSNVMVTPEGQVRLLDFGIASMLGEDGTEVGEGLSRTGLLFLTPDYAAPEQLRGDPVTTASDVYALGCLLYELLTGERARRLGGRSWSVIAPSMAEAEVLRPSARLEDPGARRRLRGDLDAIVLKALHADPRARYPSANALVEDLIRYRQGLPVSARPASASYRFRKFMGRNRVAVAVGILLLVAILAGAVGTLWQARAAALEAQRADAVAGFLFGLFEAANPEFNRGRLPDARELVDLGAARLDSLEAGAGPGLRVDLLTTLGSLYGKLGVYEPQAALYARAVEESRLSFGAEDEHLGRALTGLGVALMELGRFAEADSVLSNARRTREAAGVPDTILAETVGALATVASALGDTERSLALHREALALDIRDQGEEGLRVAADLNNVGGQLIETEEYDEAERVLERALEIRRLKLGEDHPEVAITLGLLGQLHATLGDRPGAERYHREALAVQRRVYPGGHPDIARSLDQLAITVEVQGRSLEADSLYQEALALRREWLGDAHPDVAATLNNMAVLRYRMGRYAEAAEAMQGALAAWRSALGDGHVNVAAGLNNLGTMLRELGDYTGAEEALTEALELRRKLRGARHTDVGATLSNLAGVRRLQGRWGEAEVEYLEALSILEENLPPEHPRIADACWGMGATLVDAGRSADALPYLERAVEIREGTMV
ncbi:MAG: serine/threonine-protein kinase, partial [Longimicrobiales bacterium]|nr:serine/threonine-protein kinase [Longimicrobiales bacterium]